MNNLIDVCEDFLCLNRLICATSLVLLIDFSFFNVLDLNKLIKYSIDANMTRSQARPRQSLAGVVSSRANPPLVGLSLIIRAFSASFFGRRCQLQWQGIWRLSSYTCRADCLTCPTLIRENQLVSNTRCKKYFAIDIKPDEVHCRLQNYIYLLMCTHYGIQYVGESITQLNLIMNIHGKGKSGPEISIDH